MRAARSGSIASPAPLEIFGANNIFSREVSGVAAAANQEPAVKMAAQMEIPVKIQNSASFSPSLYIIPAGHPTQKVKVPAEHVELQEQCEAVPVPLIVLLPSGKIWTPTGTDKWVCFWQPSTGKMWEFWHFTGTEGAYEAGYGGFVANTKTFNGIYTNFQGARATSLSLCGGMISIQDLIEVLRGGSIKHALLVNLPITKAVEGERGPIAPATRSDEQINNALGEADGVAESRWFRLKAHTVSEYINTVTEPVAAAIDLAMQTYGFFVGDSAGSPTINMESMQSAASPYRTAQFNPFAGLKSPTEPYFNWNASQFNFAKALYDPTLPLLKELPSTALLKIPFSLTEALVQRSS